MCKNKTKISDLENYFHKKWVKSRKLSLPKSGFIRTFLIFQHIGSFTYLLIPLFAKLANEGLLQKPEERQSFTSSLFYPGFTNRPAVIINRGEILILV